MDASHVYVSIFGDDRMETNPEFPIKYDIVNWLKIKDTSLKSFPFPENTRVTYKLTSEQFKAKVMNQILGNVQGMMPKVLDQGLPKTTGPSMPIIK